MASRASADVVVRQMRAILEQRFYNVSGKPTFSQCKGGVQRSLSRFTVTELLALGAEIDRSTIPIQCIEGFLLAMHHAHRLSLLYTPTCRPLSLECSNRPISVPGLASCDAAAAASTSSAWAAPAHGCATAVFPLRFFAKNDARVHSHIVLGVVTVFLSDACAAAPATIATTTTAAGPSPSAAESPKQAPSPPAQRAKSAAAQRSSTSAAASTGSDIQQQPQQHQPSSPTSPSTYACATAASKTAHLPPRLFSTVGISREVRLGTSRDARPSLALLVQDFIDGYAACGNEVLEVIVGGPILLPHTADRSGAGQNRKINWVLATAVRYLCEDKHWNASKKAAAPVSMTGSPTKAASASSSPTKRGPAGSSVSAADLCCDEDDGDGGGSGSGSGSPTSPRGSCRIDPVEPDIFAHSLALMEDVLVRAALRSHAHLVGMLSPAQMRVTGFASAAAASSLQGGVAGAAAPMSPARQPRRVLDDNNSNAGSSASEGDIALVQQAPSTPQKQKQVVRSRSATPVRPPAALVCESPPKKKAAEASTSKRASVTDSTAVTAKASSPQYASSSKSSAAKRPSLVRSATSPAGLIARTTAAAAAAPSESASKQSSSPASSPQKPASAAPERPSTQAVTATRTKTKEKKAQQAAQEEAQPAAPPAFQPVQPLEASVSPPRTQRPRTCAARSPSPVASGAPTASFFASPPQLTRSKVSPATAMQAAVHQQLQEQHDAIVLRRNQAPPPPPPPPLQPPPPIGAVTLGSTTIGAASGSVSTLLANLSTVELNNSYPPQHGAASSARSDTRAYRYETQFPQQQQQQHVAAAALHVGTTVRTHNGSGQIVDTVSLTNGSTLIFCRSATELPPAQQQQRNADGGVSKQAASYASLHSPQTRRAAANTASSTVERLQCVASPQKQQDLSSMHYDNNNVSNAARQHAAQRYRAAQQQQQQASVLSFGDL